MDYKQKCDELIERLRKAKYDDNVCDERFCCVIDGLVPELKESEDELTWLTKYIEEEAYSLSMDIRDNEDRIKLKKLQKALAWLEKQKEPELSEDLGEYITELSKQFPEVSFAKLSRIAVRVKNWLEKQGEQKFEMKSAEESLGISSEEYNDIVNECLYGESNSSDKEEPKFKVGDWVVDGNFVTQITGIEDDGYTNSDQGFISFETAKNFHLWTIQDAKDGDVLAVDSKPFIYNGSKNEVTVGAYCGFNSEHKFSFAYNYVINQNITPATKEQRDLLFQKMKEEDYEWDAERKELKKINKNTDVGHEYFSDLLEKDDCDNIDDYAYQCAYCMSHDWMKDTATWDDVERACKLGAEWNERHHNSSWSDEDEVMLQACLDTLQAKSLMGKVDTTITMWLKSLKVRIGG